MNCGALDDLLDPSSAPNIELGRITAITICYNESVRLPYFLKFYKSIGVTRFIVVDNGSTDGSDSILDAEPTVTRLYSNSSFAENKAAWRSALADALLPDRWVIFPDVDEFLIYPGWPKYDLNWLIDYLETSGYDALFAPMVDMYPGEPLRDITYEPGSSLFEISPYFDTGNYRLLPQLTSPEKWKTPPYRVHGGARERLFHSVKSREPTLTDRLLLRLFFSLRRPTAPGPRRLRWETRLLKQLAGCLPEKSPNMSKLPLLRWRPGTRFQSSPHRVNFAYALAPDWGTILHFKYLPDFADKVIEAATREQHISEAAHYKLYQSQICEITSQPLTFQRSRRLQTYKSMVDTGLMRISPALRKRLAELPVVTRERRSTLDVW
jgi:hypothetical protein